MKQIKVELQDWMGDDRQIAEAAWTSSFDLQNKETRSYDDVERVINLLASEKHSVPFESVVFRFWIKLPIAIDRQHMTHRIASHSGMSGRYRTMPTEYYAIPDDVQSIIQNKLPVKEYTGGLDYIYNAACINANNYYEQIMTELKKNKSDSLITNDEYKRLREFFRGMLPQHNMTERVTVMNLRSFANYYKLRFKPNAQKEIQYIAEQMYTQIRDMSVCPIAFSALDKNSWNI
jgi:flavin-dependent thymidylate synthase